MKPYSNPWKYEGKCPFVSCRKEFHSGGQGHFQAQVAPHLMNVHGRIDDAGVIMSGMMRNRFWLLPGDVKMPIWKTKWWDYSTGSPIIARQLLDEGWGRSHRAKKWHFFNKNGDSLCGKYHVTCLIQKCNVHDDYKCNICKNHGDLNPAKG